jgi:hypothetical protein
MKHKNTFLFLLSLIVAIALSQYKPFYVFILGLGGFGYVGAFFAGIFFVSTFTVSTATLVLLILTETLSPLEIGIIAGVGAVVGDLTIFRFVKDNLIREISPIYNRLGGKHLTIILNTKYFKWTLPVLGAILIASPLPDEIGVSLMGISKMKTYKFIIISYLLNSIGIFLILSASILLKP